MKEEKVGVLGLGYVGLPLAVEFGNHMPTIGFDTNKRRIDELRDGIDRTREIDSQNLRETKNFLLTNKIEDLQDCSVYIVTVPTPIDQDYRPDLTLLEKASEMVGSCLSKGDVVIYESTVYPGATEEVCVPKLEKTSGLKFNQDFYCGYSPERINPGDKKRGLKDIVKVTSASTPESLKRVDNLYKKIITAGTHPVSSIRIAEAAKVIENCQRDLNIAFVNELSILFNKLSISTKEVLEAAGTKWNFLPFKPGLVGGHCIGVDPYYLTHKAERIGYRAEVILAGRRLNDRMGTYIASEMIKTIANKLKGLKNNLKILIMGLTFKENCPDIRNSKVIDIVKELRAFGCSIEVYDPLSCPDQAKEEYGISLLTTPPKAGDGYNGVVVAVGHDEFRGMNIRSFLADDGVVLDIKGIVESADFNLY